MCGITTILAGELIPQRAAAGLADVAAAPPDNATASAAATDRVDTKKPSQKSSPKLKQASVHPERTLVHSEEGQSKSRLSDKPKPLLKEHTQLPERNPPIYEWNLPFLGPGNIISGFKSPTGAVWQPALWVFGSFQSSAGVINDGINPTREYASVRADINGNLQLTPTERIVIGFTPLSQGGNLGTGLLHVDGQGTSFVNALNPNIQTLFFEGDTRQLFPGSIPTTETASISVLPSASSGFHSRMAS